MTFLWRAIFLVVCLICIWDGDTKIVRIPCRLKSWNQCFGFIVGSDSNAWTTSVFASIFPPPSPVLHPGYFVGYFVMMFLRIFSPTFDVWDLTSYSFCIFNVYHLLNRHAGGIFTPNPTRCHLSAHQTRRQQTDHAISCVHDD